MRPHLGHQLFPASDAGLHAESRQHREQSISNESLQESEKRVIDHFSASYSEDNNVLGTEFVCKPP